MADIATYAGVPNDNVQYGILIRTGLAGPSSPEQYGNTPVFDASGQRVAPGTTIPPGAQISLGWPASGPTGGQVLTGTQIPLDAEYIRASQFADQLAGRTFDEQVRQFDQQYGFNVQQAERAYQLDLMQFGEAQAARMLNERIAAATQEYNTKRLELDSALGFGQLGIQGQQAETQRQQGDRSLALGEREAQTGAEDTLAARKLQIVDLLNQRTGPQDYVAYANTLNRLNAPNPSASQSLDVFSVLNDLESQVAAGRAGGAGASASPAGNTLATPEQMAAMQASAQQAANADRAAQTAGLAATQQAAYAAATPFSANPSASGVQPGQVKNQVDTTGMKASGQPAQFKKEKPITLMEHGGVMGGGAMAITGDSSTGRPNEELVVNLNPDPDDKILVIPLSKLLGEGTVAKKKAKGGKALDVAKMLGAPMAEEGGVYDAGLSGNTQTYNTYSPETLGNLPFLQKLRGQRDTTVGGFGSEPVNSALGIGPGDFPGAFNMRDFNRLFPSEQQMTKSLAEQGLGLNLEDLLFRSMRLSPQGHSLPVSTYGR